MQVQAQTGVDSDDDDDDDGVNIPDFMASSPRQGGIGIGVGAGPRVPPKEEMTTGRCMTCHSTVRWPRDLKVFRCTECLTVNDLVPYSGSGNRDLGGQGSPRRDGKGVGVRAIPRKGIYYRQKSCGYGL